MNLNRFDEYLSEAEQNHFKLLVVPEEGVDKEEIIASLQARGWHVYSVTKEFLRIVENIPKKKRRLRGSIEFKNWLYNLKKDKFLFDHIDVLFSPDLGKIDPIRMFKYFSRDHRSVLFFPGRIRGRQAEYSLEGKPDHMIMDISEVLCYEEEEKDGKRRA